MNYENVFEILIAVTIKYGVRPDVPLESEDFFRQLVAAYSGAEDIFPSWLEREISSQFRFVLRAPEWLQGPEWPIFQGRPMLFVGQINYPAGSNEVFHHDASYYIFLDYDTGTTKTIVQAT